MLKKIFLEVILRSLAEILFYNIFVFALWNIGLLFHTPIAKNIFWGLTILYSVYVFSALILVKNIIFEAFRTNKLILNLIVLVVFSALIQEFKTIPLRTLLFLISAALVLSLELVILYIIHLKSKK
jgi:hypothetical protein